MRGPGFKQSQAQASSCLVSVPTQFNSMKSKKRLSPVNNTIEILHKPGEKQDVSLEIYVDKKTAHALNSGQDKLYDILVLHLMGGKDIFITVSGSYTRSCFGCSIDALVQLTVPIRELSPGQV